MTHRDSTRRDIQTEMKSRRAYLYTQDAPSAAVMLPWNAFLTNVAFRLLNQEFPIRCMKPLLQPGYQVREADQNFHTQNLVCSHALHLWVVLEPSGSSSGWSIKELMAFWHSHFSQKGMRKWHNCLEATQPQRQQASLKN